MELKLIMPMLCWAVWGPPGGWAVGSLAWLRLRLHRCLWQQLSPGRDHYCRDIMMWRGRLGTEYTEYTTAGTQYLI